MYKLEKIGETSFLFKAIGSFPPSIAREAIEEFLNATRELSEFSAIIDLIDVSLIKFDSIQLIVDFFKKNEPKLIKSAVVISENPPLDVEFEYILNQVNSEKRKIVSSLEDARKWIGIKELRIQKD